VILLSEKSKNYKAEIMKVSKFKAQEDYVSRNKKDGMARTTLWVPQAMLDEIKDVGLLMRQGLWLPLADDERPKLDKVSEARRANARG
jgi:hypothetical protein